LQELKELQCNPPPNVSGGPVNNEDLFLWKATIIGPDDTPYSGGVFSLDVVLPVRLGCRL
jgi:ubiquitin-conjugating enzyme E2 D/E